MKGLRVATGAKRAKAEARRAAARRRNRRRRAIGGAVAAAIVVTAVGFAIAADRRSGPPRPVERLADIHGVAIPPWASENIYVATHAGLVRIGVDGEWWEISESRYDFMGFTANPAREGVFLTSGHPGSGSRTPNPIGVMESQDGGVTWESVSLRGEVDFHAMAASADGDVVYGWQAHGVLHRSADGGRTWDTPAGPTLQEAGGVTSFAVSPADADEVLAATRAGLWRSQDGGATWDSVHGGAVTAVAYDSSDPARVIAYAPNDGLVASDDGGEAWTPLGWTAEDDAVGSIAIHPADSRTIVVGTFGADLLLSTDGGATFTALARGGVPERA